MSYGADKLRVNGHTLTHKHIHTQTQAMTIPMASGKKMSNKYYDCLLHFHHQSSSIIITMTMTMTIDHHHHHHHDNDDHNYRFDHAVSGVHVITHQYYFILPGTQRHWYRQCSRLLILRSPSQHNSVVVITRIVSKVCTSDRRPSSLHSNELRGSSSWVLEKTWWPYCIRCTLSYFNTCHAGSFGNASIFSCLSHRPHWYRQCSGLPHIVRSITTRLLLCDHTYDFKILHSWRAPYVSPLLWGSFVSAKRKLEHRAVSSVHCLLF